MVRVGWLQRFVRAGRIVVCSALLAACAQIHNEPINQPLLPGAAASSELSPGVATYYDDTVVALSFSGGGTRAAAFSYGVLTGLDETRTPSVSTSLLDRIDFVTGVSGGSVLAAYYGLKKRKTLPEFKQRFLLRNPEEHLQLNLSFLNIAKGLTGGVNDPNQFPRWLDDNLYDHATFKSLLYQRRPLVWINASDIYDRTPFVFGKVLFGALCSDLTNYPISQAVAASAAVPVVFAPVVIQNFKGDCSVPLPEWVQRVRSQPDPSPLLSQFADAIERYHNGQVRYVKLLDGGIVDNYGLAGLTIARLASNTPYGPLEPEEGVKLRRLLFLVVDAGRAPSGNWVQTVQGPTGVDLITATSDTATGSGAVGSYAAFQYTMGDWQELVDQMALPAVTGRTPALRRAARLQLPRREILRRPHFLRTIRSSACRRTQRDRNEFSLAAGSDRAAHQFRTRGAQEQPRLPLLPRLAANVAATRQARGLPGRRPAGSAGAVKVCAGSRRLQLVLRR